MITTLAHVTPMEFPTGLLLMAAGFALGVLATVAFRRLRIGRRCARLTGCDDSGRISRCICGGYSSAG
jgi:hypothetical protein